MSCLFVEGGREGGQIHSLRSAYISNLSHQIGLQPSKKFLRLEFCLFYTSLVVVVVLVLSNSSPKSKVQTSVLGLVVDFVFPLSQEQ